MALTEPLHPDAERLEALAEFAAGAGHEINNPLATIIGRAQQLLRDESDPQRRHSLSVIASQAYRIRDMIGDVMAFARPPLPNRASVELVGLVREVIARLQSSLTVSGCLVDFTAPDTLFWECDAAQLAIVVSELIRNAADACRDSAGQIQVRVVAVDAQSCAITVEDSGLGFSERELRHAFDPFFSGRQAGRGLGFGLCKVWQIVRQHGGHVEISSTGGGPTRVSVMLPSISS